jgi:hypothetical protein
MDNVLSTPEQLPGNQKTHWVYMTVEKTEEFISSDQTGMFLVTYSTVKE